MVSSVRALPTTSNIDAQPESTMRRLSQAIFGVLEALSSPRGARVTPPTAGIDELPGLRYATALRLRQECFDLPPELQLVPDRINTSPTMQAAGFSDPRAASVGVDVARWSAPCCEALDEVAWRRIFTWVVGTDENLTNVAVLAPPALRAGRMIGAYSYVAGGVQGYGVLQVSASEDGAWHICDCWGDADDADRIDALSRFSLAA